MKEYKLTEAEARALATEIAKSRNKIYDLDKPLQKWASEYITVYRDVMAAFGPYTDAEE